MARKPQPNPFPEYGLRTRFLEIERGDWTLVRRGTKTEYRTLNVLTHLLPPALVVGWRKGSQGQPDPDTLLLVVERAWREPLGAISPESLQREGFPGLEYFRRYWMNRHGVLFRPLQEIQVLRLRPFTEDDVATVGRQFILNLYGPYVSDGLRQQAL